MKWEPIEIRFWRKVEKAEGGCWNWIGGRAHQYGIFRLHNTQVKRAHVVSYELVVGAIPDGKELDHVCRNTLCVNPAHLEAVSHAENIRRGLRGRLHAQPETCKNGHALRGKNLIMRRERVSEETQVRWRCRLCERDKTRRYRARMKG